MAQETALRAFVTASLPRNTRQIGAFIEKEFGIVYESCSGLIALLHRMFPLSLVELKANFLFFFTFFAWGAWP